MHAIYNPVSRYTPLEREVANAHRARAERFNAAALKQPGAVPEIIAPKPLAPIPDSSIREAHNLLREGNHLGIRLEVIFRAVLAHFPNVTMTDLLAARRDHAALIPRQIAMYVAKKMTLRSLPEIGRRLGRDHSTVLSAVRRIENLRATNEKLNTDVCAIITALGGAVE